MKKLLIGIICLSILIAGCFLKNAMGQTSQDLFPYQSQTIYCKPLPTPTPVPIQSPTPVPTAAPIPTPIPTAIPTAPPSTIGNFSNAVEWPASFRPYGATSPWNTPLPDNAIKYVDSDAIIANIWGSPPSYPPRGTVIQTSEGGQFDVSRPIYFAKSTDPLVYTKCTIYCNGLSIPAQIRIPAKARPAYGSDQHLAVVQPDGTEIDFWGADKPTGDWQTGQTLKYWSGNACGNFYNGSGFNSPSATVGNGCLAGGVIRPSELQSGQINHALVLLTNCTQKGVGLYPASPTGGGALCTGTGRNIPLGARVQLTLTDAQIDALNVSVWQKTILRAMHRYGGYIMDTTGAGGSKTTSLLAVGKVESPQPYLSFGVPVPFDELAKLWGWRPIAIQGTTEPRYFSPDVWGIDLGAYVRIIHPCYAQGTCH